MRLVDPRSGHDGPTNVLVEDESIEGVGPDVSGAAGAEWLTLGPAMLWAGADEALVTLYPIFKDAPAESDTVPPTLAFCD